MKPIQESPNKETRSDFELERYKYILSQIQHLNEGIHKYLSLFQTLTTAIVGGGVALFVKWKEIGISPEIARTAMNSLLWLLITLALFLVFSIVSGMFSWFDYRKEEVELLNRVVGQGFRKAPKLKNAWRWYETYVLIFIIVVVTLISCYVNATIIPMIK